MTWTYYNITVLTGFFWTRQLPQPLKKNYDKLKSSPEHLAPPARYGSEESGRQVSGGVDGVAAVAPQGNADQEHQQARHDALAAPRRRFVPLVWERRQAQQQHGRAEHLDTREGLVYTGERLSKVTSESESESEWALLP